MSRKWNPFSRKKNHKADSHGTTLANEEMFFQPSVRAGNKWCTTINPNHEQEMKSSSKINETQESNSSNDIVRSEKMPSDTHCHNLDKNEVSAESQVFLQKHDQTRASHYPMLQKLPSAPEPPVLSSASVPRTSPRIARKLIKPGASANEQQSYLIPTTTGKPVNIIL